MSIDYARLESELNEVLALAPLSEAEVMDVRRFLDAGEYGIALETLCSILQEGNKVIPPKLRDRLLQLAQRMRITVEL